MRLPHMLFAAPLALIVSGPAPAQVAVATYEFNNNYHADEPGKPDLNPFNPVLLSFTTDTVNVGSQSLSRPALVRGGSLNAAPANQVGVELSTGTLLTNPNTYSVELVFSMDTGSAAFERVLNTNDGSDNGLYLNGNNVRIFPSPSGSSTFTYGPSTYHHLVLTNDGTTATEYLDGTLDSFYSPGANASVMNNPNDLMRFFLDNTTGGANSEFGPGRVALLRLYDQVLTGPQVATLAANPFPVPEPGTIVLSGAAALVGLLVARRRRTAAPAKS